MSEYDEALKAQSAWVTDDDLAMLEMERHTGARSAGTYESPLDQAKRMMRESAPMAAASLIKLAKNSENDSVRMRASVEILNRAEGGVGVDGKEPWAQFYEDAHREIEAHAQGHSDGKSAG